MAWEPITTVDQLIARTESSSLDFKTVYDFGAPNARYEIAKDVAAFANAFGGSIVVGIREVRGRPVRIDGVANVPKLKEELCVSLDRFCMPLPATPEDHVIVVPPEAARRILAGSAAAPTSETPVDIVTLNVAPDPRAPIGVRPFDNPSGRALADAWRFPVRIADQSRFLDPTELPMWMNSHERRVAIHLRQLFAQRARVPVLVHCKRGEQHQQTYEKTLLLTGVDEGRLCATFEQEATPGHLVVPFSFILSVWQAGPDAWEMAINGSMHAIGGLRFRLYLGGA